MDNRFNEVFSLFNSLNKEFSSGSHIIDIFSSWFSFYHYNKCSNNILIAHSYKLDNITITSSLDQSCALVVTNISIKNNMTTFITHIHVHDKPVIKTLYHTGNIISTKAELFTIRCGINQAIKIQEISKIIVVTNSIHATKRICDLSLHLYQIHLISISNELRKFFLLSSSNSIKFWECPSWCSWLLHKAVNGETKQFCHTLLFPCKLSWDFSKKNKYDNIIKNWKMTFQALDLKGCHFLDLVNNDDNPIKPSYANSRLWLKYFGHSNSLYARSTRAIVNHAPISKYRLRFFPWEEFKYSCGLYPIKTRWYILYEYRRFNEYWNLRRDTLSHFTLILEFNGGAFVFVNATT